MIEKRQKELYVAAYYKHRGGIWSIAILKDATVQDAKDWNEYQTRRCGEETTVCLSQPDIFERKENTNFEERFALLGRRSGE